MGGTAQQVNSHSPRRHEGLVDAQCERKTFSSYYECRGLFFFLPYSVDSQLVTQMMSDMISMAYCVPLTSFSCVALVALAAKNPQRTAVVHESISSRHSGGWMTPTAPPSPRLLPSFFFFLLLLHGSVTTPSYSHSGVSLVQDSCAFCGPNKQEARVSELVVRSGRKGQKACMK